MLIIHGIGISIDTCLVPSAVVVEASMGFPPSPWDER